MKIRAVCLRPHKKYLLVLLLESDGGVADQEEECIVTQSQEGGGSGGEEMVTGVHDRNVPTTNINTNNETLTNSGNSEDRGGKQNMSTDGDCSEDGVRPAVIMCPTLQEEITICHEETSSENSVVTPPNCVEEEDEGESEKVFVTMKSEIFHFPTASYPCFCLNDPSIPGKEDSLPKFICPLNVVFVSDPYSEADEKGVFTSLYAPKAIVGKTNNSSRDKESGVRSGVVKISKSETTVKMMAGGVRMDEFKSYDVFKNIFDSLCSYLTEVLERIRREVDILRAKHDYFSQFLIAESIDEQALLESIGKFYSLYNGDGSVVASMPTRNYQWLGRPDIFHKKFAKWMYAGVALGFHGLDKLIYLKATPPWAAALTGCFGLTLMSGEGYIADRDTL
ncbi:hypothetical protein GBAR_LOCUS11596 [Geodia barretti]|uniref:Uncharacterized protein n=1 Tax=Geodia barretti TaxID=519541 RepID=A0AA35RYG8_GEOBA|nr:hypothetical protein GBAR_LOCUS11596 [Geodia barretti]